MSDVVERLKRLNRPALLPSLRSVMADAVEEIERLRLKEELRRPCVICGERFGKHRPECQRHIGYY